MINLLICNLIISSLIGVFLSLAKKQISKLLEFHLEKKLKQIETDLVILASKKTDYNSHQLDRYSLLWSKLIQLQFSADRLWTELNEENLAKFSKKLFLAEKQIQKSSLFVEDRNYEEFMRIISTFKEFQVGKKSLLKYYEDQFSYNEQQARQILENKNLKDDLERIIYEIKTSLKKQISA